MTFVWRPMRAVLWLLESIGSRMSVEERGALYQKALNTSSLGARQARELFTNQIRKFVLQGKAAEMSGELLQITIEEGEIMLSENKENILMYLILGNFYSALAEQDLKNPDKVYGNADELLRKAENVLVQGVNLSPGNQRAYTGLANVYLLQGKTGDGIQMLQKAVDLYPEYPDSHWNLGRVYFIKKNFHKAKESFEKALEFGYRMNNPTHIGNLARTYFEIKEYEKAIEWYKKVVEKSPKDPKAHYTLAIIYRDAGDHEKAREQIEIVKELNPATTTIMEMDKFLETL